MKILSLMKLSDCLENKLKQYGEYVRKKHKHLEIKDIEDVHIIIGNIDKDLIMYCKELKVLQLDSAGSDTYIDVIPKGCILCNASGTFGATISEHLIMTTLMLFRNMPTYINNQANHIYQGIYHVKTIKGSRFMIFGTGDLGSEYAKRIQMLGGYTIGIKRNEVASLPYFNEVYANDKIDGLLDNIDVVCLCLPRNNETTNILDKKRLSKLKNDAIVLNVGRGNALDQEYLCEMLNQGKLLGAALDVFKEEPIPCEDKIWNCKNLIITPHVSGNFSSESTYLLFYEIVENNIECYFNGKPLQNVVDCKSGY